MFFRRGARTARRGFFFDVKTYRKTTMQSFHSKFLTLGVVAASAVMLTACGGGSGGSGNTNSPLTAQMGSQTCYVGQACQITIKGGEKPYSLFSSEQKVTPNATIDKPGVYTFYPNSVPAGTGSSSSSSSSAPTSGTLNLVVTTKKSTWAAGANFKIDLSVNILLPQYTTGMTLTPASGKCTNTPDDDNSGCVVGGDQATVSVGMGPDAFSDDGTIHNLKFIHRSGDWAFCAGTDCSLTEVDFGGDTTITKGTNPEAVIKANNTTTNSIGFMRVQFTDNDGKVHSFDYSIFIQAGSASAASFMTDQDKTGDWGTSSAPVSCATPNTFGFSFQNLTGAQQVYSFSATAADGTVMQ
jgi:hypothetical protein